MTLWMQTMPLTAPESYILAGWSLLTTLIGGIGSVLVVVSVLLHRFKIDTTSTWFITNIAVSDVCYVVVMVIPSVVSNFTLRWVLGDVLCLASSNIGLMFATSHLIFSTILSINKLLRCLFPLRSLYAKLSKRSGIIVTVVVWVVSVIPTFEQYYLKRGVQFDTSINRCFIPNRNTTDQIWYKLDRLNYLLYTATPLFLITISNMMLLCIALRNANTRSKFIPNTPKFPLKTISMVMMLSLLVIIAWTPVTIYAVAVKAKNVVFYRVAHYSIPIDTALTPLCYCYFNESFRRFVCGLVTGNSMSSRDYSRNSVVVAANLRNTSAL